MSTDTLPPFRRIITTNGDDGRSRILADAPVAHVLQSGPQRGLINMWATDTSPPSLASLDDAVSPVRLEPPTGGTVFRLFQLGPKTALAGDPDAAERAATSAFERMGAAHLRVDTTRHPSMHKSHTLDYIMLLKGRVRLVLDEEETELEPFDVVIQRGTNHAWINLEDEPALMMGVLMDAAREPQDGDPL